MLSKTEFDLANIVVKQTVPDTIRMRHVLTAWCVRNAGIQEMLERVSGEKGMVWEDFFAKLKKNNQWHVEVY